MKSLPIMFFIECDIIFVKTESQLDNLQFPIQIYVKSYDRHLSLDG